MRRSKRHCDEELANTEEKKGELDDDIAALTAKIDKASSQTASVKERVAEAQESGHCFRGGLEHALQLLGLMQRRGIQPDAILFNFILDGCAHKQMRSMTETVLNDMQLCIYQWMSHMSLFTFVILLFI